MGVLDFAKGVGDALKTGLTKVGDTTIGIGKDLGGSGVTLGNMVGYASDPTHWDDIAKGGEKAVEFTAKHPGAAAKIGGTIAKKVAVDSVTTPSGIVTTAAALLSGGAGLAGKFAEAGKIAKGIEVAGEVGEIGKVVEGASAGAKGAEAMKGLETAAKVSRTDKLLGAGVKVGESGALERTAFSKARDPLNLVSKGRTAVAERILAGAGDEAPSIGRQVAAAMVQGTSGTKPIRMAGISDEVAAAQESVWRVRQAGSKLSSAPNARKALKTAANPRQAVFDAAKTPQGREVAQGIVRDQVHQAFKQFEEPGTGQQVMDFGQPKPAGYGGPGYQPQLPLEWPDPAKPGEFSGYTKSGGYGELTQPGSAAGKTTATGTAASSASSRAGSGGSSRGGKSSMRAWQGPGREVFGGITPGFDWRNRNWGMDRNTSFKGGAKAARGGSSSESSSSSESTTEEDTSVEAVKNPYIDEPVDLSQPGSMNLAQFPKTKVVPGSTLQSGGGVKFGDDDKPSVTILTGPKQPKQQVLGV